MSTLAMEYGSSGRVNTNGVGMRQVLKGDITDATVITFIPDVGGCYLLFTKEWNASTGAYRGHRMHVVAVPEEARYGSYACQRLNTVHSDNAGVTITYVNDSTITIERSSATYAVRYAIYKVF